MWVGAAEIVPPLLSSLETRNLYCRTASLEQLSQESLWGRVPMRECSIARKKHERLRLPGPSWRSFLNVSYLHHEPPLGVSNRFPDRIVFGVHLERVHTLPYPQGYHHRPRKRRLGLRVEDLPPVGSPAVGAEEAVPTLRHLGPRGRAADQQPHTHRDAAQPSAHRPPRGGTGRGERTPMLCSSNRSSSAVSGSCVPGKSWAALSIATNVLKASLRSSGSDTAVMVAVASGTEKRAADTPGGCTCGRSGTGE